MCLTEDVRHAEHSISPTFVAWKRYKYPDAVATYTELIQLGTNLFYFEKRNSTKFMAYNSWDM